MRSLIFIIACSVVAAPLAAQTIDPGMTREQVVAKLGEPLSTHTYQGHVYLMYKNGCEKTCGMNDLVVLDSGKVVDAVFRAADRKYSGQSSSPKMISAADARRGPDGAAAPLALPKTASPAPVKKPPTAPAKTAAPTKTPVATKAAVPTKVAAPPPAAKTVQPPAKTLPATPAKKPTADSGKKAAPAPAKKPSPTA